MIFIRKIITRNISGGEKMKNTDIKVKILIACMVVIIIVTIGLYLYKDSKDEEYIYYEENSTSEVSNEENETKEEMITVHIVGEIKYPGVVVLKNGDRIVDAIEAAGGETENADLNRLNLAYILSDGDKINVPNKNDGNEIDNTTTVENAVPSKEKESININAATLEELTELPGIGEATANKIIEYRRQNGKFETIEDIKNVPGIGDSKFENLKQMIKVK